MKKRITLAEWNSIGVYNPAAKWIRPLCTYTLEQTQPGVIKREAKVGWFAYLMMFIPVHIFKLVWCLWDGGLKEFEIEGRDLTYHYYYESDAPYSDYYEKAKNILERA